MSPNLSGLRMLGKMHVPMAPSHTFQSSAVLSVLHLVTPFRGGISVKHSLFSLVLGHCLQKVGSARWQTAGPPGALIKNAAPNSSHLAYSFFHHLLFFFFFSLLSIHSF